jgi:hypothetical protein
MSTTPITDANMRKVWSAANDGMGDDYAEHVVDVEVAQQLELQLIEAKRLLRLVTMDIKWMMNPSAVMTAFNEAEIRDTLGQADKYLAN